MNQDHWNRETFQRMNAAIRPDGWLQSRTKAAMKKEAGRSGRGKGAAVRCAAALAVCAAAVGCVLLAPGEGPRIPPVSGGLESAAGSAAPSPPARGFTLQLRMSKGGDASDVTGTVTLQAGLSCRWGKKTVRRSDKVYVNPEGEKYYGVKQTGITDGHFLYVDGEGIAKVTVTSELRTLSIRTKAWADYTEKRHGNTDEVRMTAPAMTETAFLAYWETPACDDARKALEETFGPQLTGQRYGFSFGEAVGGTMPVSIRMSWLPAVSGMEIDYAKDGGIHSIDWHPRHEDVAAYPAIPYEDIPGDTVTFHVTFTDGHTASARVYLCLDAQGYVVARLLP